MTTFVLLHGSFHAAWNWHKVVPILEGLGHRGVAIDLPGHGLDPKAAHRVSLRDCVDGVSRCLHSVQGEVVLVAHSRSGIVISQAAERHSARVLGLVYLAAYLVPNGKSMMDFARLDKESLVVQNVQPRIPRRGLGMLQRMAASELGRSLLTHTLPVGLLTHALQPAAYQAALYHDCPPEITELAQALLEPEPSLPGFTPLTLTAARYGRVPKVYIECTQDRAVTPWLQRSMYQQSPCDHVYTLDASHSPFFSCPELLCDVFNQSLGVFRQAGEHVATAPGAKTSTSLHHEGAL